MKGLENCTVFVLMVMREEMHFTSVTVIKEDLSMPMEELELLLSVFPLATSTPNFTALSLTATPAAELLPVMVKLLQTPLYTKDSPLD